MATDAKLTLVTEADLGNKGLVVTVSKDGTILGHLMIGKASLIWFEKHAKKRGHKVSWDETRQWLTGKPESKATRP